MKSRGQLNNILIVLGTLVAPRNLKSETTMMWPQQYISQLHIGIKRPYLFFGVKLATVHREFVTFSIKQSRNMQLLHDTPV